LIGALMPGPGLDALLEERLQLLCGRATCPADRAAVVVKVSRRRCEICSGSDLRAAFDGWVRAASESGIRRVTIVGGSPAYRRQLRDLAKEVGGPRMELVSGTRNRDSRKVAADIRGSDIIVLWGATLLDHSVSEAYRAARPEQRLQVGERGMARMLESLRRKARPG
jgi:hypothetical protein